MKGNIRQSSYLADKELLKEFSIFCTRKETTKTKLIVGFIEGCLRNKASENKG